MRLDYSARQMALQRTKKLTNLISRTEENCMNKISDWSDRHNNPNPIYWRLILRQAKGWPLTYEERDFLACMRLKQLNMIVMDGGRLHRV